MGEKSHLIDPGIQAEIRIAGAGVRGLEELLTQAEQEYRNASPDDPKIKIEALRVQQDIARELVDSARRYLARRVRTYVSVAGDAGYAAAARLLGDGWDEERARGLVLHWGYGTQWITLREAAEIVGISRQALALLASAGRRGITARRSPRGQWEIYRPSLAGFSVSETSREHGRHAARVRLGRETAEATA